MTVTLALDNFDAPARENTPWAAVVCLSMLTFVLVGAEFMPISLLTQISADLGTTEGQAGQAISISGLFAVVTALFGNTLLPRMERRAVTLLYTGVLIASGVVVTFASNYLMLMFGRALIGIAIGGFWSLSTAILARLVPSRDLPKAITLLQGGTALASVLAAPVGSFLGGVIGWRGAFFTVVPIGIAALVWQLAVLPKIPADGSATVGKTFALLRNRTFAIGMAATTLAFMGQLSLLTYLRPFLEIVPGLDVNGVALSFFALGVAGMTGTFTIGLIVRKHLRPVLFVLPAGMAVLAVLFIAFGQYLPATVAMLVLWGFLSNPIPVAWNTWMARLIPDELEAGGGLQVALIQFAITFGSFSGGLLFDALGWWGPFASAAVLLTASAAIAVAAGSRT